MDQEEGMLAFTPLPLRGAPIVMVDEPQNTDRKTPRRRAGGSILDGIDGSLTCVFNAVVRQGQGWSALGEEQGGPHQAAR